MHSNKPYYQLKSNLMKKFTLLSLLVFLSLLIPRTFVAAQDVNLWDTVEVVLERSSAAGNLPAAIDDWNATRGATFNGEYIFVASRQDGNHVWYWDVNNPTANPQELNITGVTGGTFVISDVASAENHVFLSNMAFAAGNFRLYHWSAIDTEPQVLVNWENIPARLGDAISVVGNPDSNARVFVSGHGTTNFYVWELENGNLVNAEPEIVTVTVEGVTNLNFGRVTAYGDSYILSGPFGVIVLNDDYTVAHNIPQAFFPGWPMYAKVWDYEGSTYLSYMNVTGVAPHSSTLRVLDLDEGTGLEQKIENLGTAVYADRLVYEHVLGNVANTNASVGHDVIVDEDDQLWLFGFSAANGFVLLRVGEGQDPDDLIYSITLALPAGEYEYKYFVVVDQPNWNLGEWAGDPNRMVVISRDTIIHDVWGDRPAEGTPGGKQDQVFLVTFEVDMNDAKFGPDSIEFDPNLHRVFIAGGFGAPNEWNEPGTNPALEMTIGNTGVVSVPEVVAETITLRLFPNPAVSHFTVESQSRINQILVSDVTGRTIQSLRTDAFQVNVQTSDLRNGIYIITVYTDSGVSVGKLQVRR
jgi:archaellum component FlaG (FlaF/FlaG flagellin family)